MPPITRSPGPFSTGIGSPRDHRLVDRARALDTTPSTGTFSPGRTRSRSPGTTWSSGTSSSRPSSRSRRAVLGARPEQRPDRAAGLAPRPQLEHLPQQDERRDHRRRLEVDRRPRRGDRGTSPGRDPGASAATTLKTNAVPVPSAISVNMLRLRLTSDAQPRSKNGHPPQRTTGVASASWTQTRVRPPSQDAEANQPGTISAIESSKSGTVSARQIQNRRVMSTSSGSSSASSGQRGDRLQRHPADRARARPIADDLRVHRAGVLVRPGASAEPALTAASGPGRSSSSPCAGTWRQPSAVNRSRIARGTSPGNAGSRSSRSDRRARTTRRPSRDDVHPADRVLEVPCRRRSLASNGEGRRAAAWW